MTLRARIGVFLLVGLATGAAAQTLPAYGEFALGKWAELQAQSRGGGALVQQALDHYTAAMAADPGSAYIAMQEADLLSRLGRQPEAIALGVRTAASHPDSVVTHTILGRIYLRDLDRERQPISSSDANMMAAVNEYKTLIRLEPRVPEPVVVLGELYGAEGNASGAEQQFRAALALAPADLDALASLIHALASQNQLAQAQQVVAGLPPAARTGEVYATLGDVLASHHEPAAAAAAYREALGAEPGTSEYESALAKALLDANDLTGALTEYQTLAQASPEDGNAHLRLGQLQMRMGDTEGAGSSLATAAKLIGADNLEVAYAQAMLAEQQGRDGDAARQLEMLVNRHTAPGTQSIFLSQLAQVEMRSNATAVAATLDQMRGLGPVYRARANALAIELYSGQRDYAAALKAATAARKDEPDSHSLALTYASLMAASGQEAAAETQLSALLKGGASDWDVFLTRGEIELQASQWNEAAADSQRADALASTPADHARAQAQLASLEFRQLHYAPAEQLYRQALALDPGNAAVLNGLGYAMAQQGEHLTEALGYVQQAVAQDAENGAYRDSLGWIYFKMNRLPEAVRNLERAAQLSSRSPAILDHLAQAYEGGGKLQEAETSWQRALADLKLDPGAVRQAERANEIQHRLDAVRVRIAESERH